MFQQIDMPVSIRHAYDVYMEEAVGVILSMLSDICDSHVNGDPDMFSNLLAAILDAEKPVWYETVLDRDLMFRGSPFCADPVVRAIRLDWLYVLDSRLCKLSKIHLRQIYARIYTVNPGIQDLLGWYHFLV